MHKTDKGIKKTLDDARRRATENEKHNVVILELFTEHGIGTQLVSN